MVHGHWVDNILSEYAIGEPRIRLQGVAHFIFHKEIAWSVADASLRLS